MSISDLAKRGFVFLRQARVTNLEFYITVKDIQHPLTYRMDEFLFTINYKGLTQSCFSSIEHVKVVIDRFHTLHRYCQSRRPTDILSGIICYETTVRHSIIESDPR